MSKVPGMLGTVALMMTARSSKSLEELRCVVATCDNSLRLMRSGNIGDIRKSKYRDLLTIKTYALQNLGDFVRALETVNDFNEIVDKGDEKAPNGLVGGLHSVYAFCMAAAMLTKKHMQTESCLELVKHMRSVNSDMSKRDSVSEPVMGGTMAMAYFAMRNHDKIYREIAKQTLLDAAALDPVQIERERVKTSPFIKAQLPNEWFAFLDEVEADFTNVHYVKPSAGWLQKNR